MLENEFFFTKTKNKSIGYYYFRLEFGHFHRYSESFQLSKLPDLETQKIMVQIYFDIPEIKELIELYGFTGFELCENDFLNKDSLFYTFT